VHDASRTNATIRLAADGDQAAFAALVDEHHAAMARVAYVVAGDAELAADAVQSAWEVAWRRLHTLRQPDRIRAWLVAIAANEARGSLRRQRRVTFADPLALEMPGPDDAADSIDLVDLHDALRSLKPNERSLLALRYVAGLDSTEIATQLGMTPSGVRSRLARLLERLRMDLDHV
jgi:RNA polymerase sigma factor (sigma-70 family)